MLWSKLWFLSSCIASLWSHQPLLDPSSMVEHRIEDHFGTKMRVRGSCISGEKRGTATVHLDVFSEGGATGVIAEPRVAHLVDFIREEANSTLCSIEDERQWAITEILGQWRFGYHPAVICQVDSMLSIAEEIRSGRFIRSLFSSLYSDQADALEHFTLRGVAIGAGMIKNATDPMQLWAREYGEKVLLVDENSSRLEIALGELNMHWRFDQNPNLNATGIIAVVKPDDLDQGYLHEAIRQHLEASGREPLNRIDVLQIDIDSFDCEVLRIFANQYDASVIVIESQPLVPPPIKFARMWHPEDAFTQGFAGCSLSYQLKLLHPTHHLLVYTEDDTIFVHARLSKTLEKLSAASPRDLIPWTTYPLRFPIDEIDCYRRSRTLLNPRLVKWGGSGPALPVETMREWALQLHPSETLRQLWKFLTISQEPSGGIPFYSLDL